MLCKTKSENGAKLSTPSSIKAVSIDDIHAYCDL